MNKTHEFLFSSDPQATGAVMAECERWLFSLVMFLAVMCCGCDSQASQQLQVIQDSLQKLQQSIGDATIIKSASPEVKKQITSQFQSLLEILLRVNAAGTQKESQQAAVEILNHPTIQQILISTELVDFQNINGSSLLSRPPVESCLFVNAQGRCLRESAGRKW
ncbi:hypothetical protein C7M84_025105 [Penaeus vannamei]|uniref:Uncharacterized protein n=1 Tax=Penaeus vannamei TaxID=6689 RepID=A0A423TZ69_PENVA|nr:hypothetical protein C7M84_025105 [Penaeus vannamei]